MNLWNRSNQKEDEPRHVWITIDISSLPATALNTLANCTTDERILDVLADSSSISARLQVAENVHAGAETLRRLAKDLIVFVREAVAENSNTPPDVLAELSRDEDMYVRLAATSNLNMPVSSLILKLFDSQSEVIVAAIQNPKTPIENIEVLKDTEDVLVLYAMKRRLATSKVTKKELNE